MAMTKRQIQKRMIEAWELCYKQYDMEAKWYGNEEDYIWACDIPSLNITVKMELEQTFKRIVIYEATLEKQSDYRHVRETKWEVRSYYGWQ